MKTMRAQLSERRLIVFAMMCLCLLKSAYTLAAPGKLSDKPLFSASGVKPNVLFVIDDSGSMENEVLQRNGVSAFYPDNPKDSTGANNGNLDMTPDSDREYLELCAGYNILAFDINKVMADIPYKPWPGYPEIDVTGANPTAPAFAAGRRYDDDMRTQYGADNGGNGGDHPRGAADLNLNTTGYVRWDDNNNEVFDSEECGADPELNFVAFTSMSLDEKQNFANWYTYHRKRRFLVTAPMLDVVANEDLRVGMATINNDADVGHKVVDLETDGNRTSLKNSILKLGSANGTPLRRPLDNAGRYYAGENYSDNFVTDRGEPAAVNAAKPGTPILPDTEGGNCQQNYTMLMTDGYSNENNGSRPLGLVENADGDNSTDYDDNGMSADSYYGDIYSNTMGDIAMYYYERDLDGNDNNNDVKSNDPLDTNPAQHMVTYTVAFGVTANIPVDDNGNLIVKEGVKPPWPAANGTTLWQGEKTESLDDLVHAAVNGRGKFLSAGNGAELSKSIEDVVNSIKAAAAAGGSGAVNFNSSNVSANTLLYSAGYSTDDWNGTLEAFKFSSTTGVPAFGSTRICPTNPALDCATNAADCVGGCFSLVSEFEAGEKLKSKAPGARNVITYNGTKGVPFRFPADFQNPTADEMSTDQIDDLKTNSPSVADTQAFGVEIVDFLRGDNSDAKKAKFRDRGGFVLGDIANSSPQYVGVPNANYPDSIAGVGKQLYSQFVKSKSLPNKRRGVVYVGANDGMLHAFDADDGEELFAYIPGELFSNQLSSGLHFLAQSDYTHKPYVDATPTIADAYVDGAWRTYLVGGYGGGARGIYVLDVTDPNNFTTEANANTIIKDEFGFKDHPDLGFIYTRPQIVKMNNGDWAAVFGNGYGGGKSSQAGKPDGTAKLFIYYFKNGLYKVLPTGVGSIVNEDCLNDASDCNGLSTPQLVDFDRDGVVDRIYAGDLHGNMWAFDVTDGDANNWAVAHKDGVGDPVPMFTACADAMVNGVCLQASRQPITTQPTVTGHKYARGIATRPNTLVLFGTGQFLTEADVLDESKQSFYAVWDAGPRNGEKTRDNLALQTFASPNNDDDRGSLSNNAVNYSLDNGGEFGWYIDLPRARERLIVDPVIGGEIVLFATSIPAVTPCDLTGDGYLIAADIFSGGLPSFQVFSGSKEQSSIRLLMFPNGLTGIDGNFAVRDALGKDDRFEAVNTSRNSRSRRINWSIIR